MKDSSKGPWVRLFVFCLYILAISTIGILVHQGTVGEQMESLANAFNTVEKNDAAPKELSQRIVTSYLRDSEEKLKRVRYIQNITGFASAAALIAGLLFILYPSLKRLTNTNRDLLVANEKLNNSNQELRDIEEEIRGNLEHIQSLQNHLELKEQQYREIVEHAEDAIYEVDDKGIINYVNPTLEGLTGQQRDDLVGKPYWKIIQPHHKDRVLEFYGNQMKQRQERSYIEFPIVTESGKSVWLGQKNTMFYRENGWLQHATFISRDITELKEVQEKLQSSERLYRLISTNSRELISLYENRGQNPIRTYISPSVRDILGFDPKELVGLSAFDYIHPEDVDILRSNFNPLKSARNVTSTEYRVQKKDGAYIWIESNTQPFFDNNGSEIGFQTSSREITKRKMEQVALQEAKDKAEEVSKAKSQFLSMISHEIRTPMNGVIGLTNFLLDENPREDQLKHLRLLKFSGENLLTIINDILDFSKIEAEKINIENISFDLKTLVDNAVQTASIRASDKGVPLILKYDERLPALVKGDPVRLSQIINNLVTNAVKFTNAGFVHFTIKSEGARGNRHKIFFSVKDTGIGIPADKINSIFEHFTQASPETTRKFGGTGLGLAITKKLLSLMGSDIDVQSELGKGSEFMFTLSLDEAEADLQEGEDLSYANHASAHNAHILLVEDNDVNQIVASNYLYKWGFKVSVAENGQEALELIKQKAFHLVLMDLQMPNVDGYEATRRIRSMNHPYYREVPILALTASAMEEDIGRLSEFGINDYIAKPFEPSELEDKIFRNLLPHVPDEFDNSTQKLLNNFSGFDPQVNLDLAHRMINNIRLLQGALDKAIRERDPEIFARACHKMKTTVAILKDRTFSDKIEDLKATITIQTDLAGQLERKKEFFATICILKIKELESFITNSAGVNTSSDT